ncbi:TPA: prepilin peptidase [Salmonella enterica subsp. enterica serovar Reading]|nr:hypothetical protein [Salmonella enterica]EBS3610829.1 hypothetical protein [Salmonella enterica subsp. enterica serovar Poona]EBU6211441.1 hypothetical protein [Salmonella enterica subsp. enterica]EGB1030935.1 hypothetical protein [Salmonella enterica subsp. enterica serovar Reading]EGI5703759.1 hypothetical protein [Salmonella enterica subsp. enterica serovar Chester]HEC8371899.1 prepilin peptidase [Salmonella enterica subsp. enterica serovar Muenchen]
MINFIILTAISAGLIYVIYSDIRFRLIKNSTVLYILFFSICKGWGVNSNMLVFIPLLILFIGIFLNYFGAVGAGDIKLITALSLGMSETEILRTIVFMGFSGVPLTIACIVYSSFFKKEEKVTIPYGVAISTGYWFAHFLP